MIWPDRQRLGQSWNAFTSSGGHQNPPLSLPPSSQPTWINQKNCHQGFLSKQFDNYLKNFMSRDVSGLHDWLVTQT